MMPVIVIVSDSAETAGTLARMALMVPSACVSEKCVAVVVDVEPLELISHTLDSSLSAIGAQMSASNRSSIAVPFLASGLVCDRKAIW